MDGQVKFEIVDDDNLDTVQKISRKMAKSASSLSKSEARFLVDSYYTIQNYRITSKHQIRTLTATGNTHAIIEWLSEQTTDIEKQIKRALDKWTDSKELGRWCKSIMGIGPVITAGLMSNIDIEKCPTAGHIWSFAGIHSGDVKWEKGMKRPFNATFKSLVVYKLGESFVKVQNKEEDIYGHLFVQRKKIEIANNEQGLFAPQAEKILATKRIGKDTDAYKHYSMGKLPPAHIHARARRWAVKIFLSHYHAVAYKLHFGKEPPAPYPIAILGHAHMIEVPDQMSYLEGII